MAGSCSQSGPILIGHQHVVSSVFLQRTRFARIGTEHPALFLQDILAVIDNSQIIDRIQREIIHLSNQVMIADGREAREIQDLKKSLRKVLGYANIGLELLSKRDTRTAAEIMEAAPMQFLFRAGYSQGLDLKNRLEQLHKIQWQNCRPFRPLFFDGPWGATIEGLSQVRPVYFEGNSKPDSFLFRDFESIAEICVTRQVLDIVGVADKVLFELLGVDIHNLDAYLSLLLIVRGLLRVL